MTIVRSLTTLLIVSAAQCKTCITNTDHVVSQLTDSTYRTDGRHGTPSPGTSIASRTNRETLQWDTRITKHGSMGRALHSDSTVRSVRTSGDVVWIRSCFSGSGIYLFGNATSPYSVTLDNRVVLDSGINQNSTLLYADGGLGVDNTHYITLTANISDTSQILALDRALVESTLSNGYVYHPASILGRKVLITLMQGRIPYINGLR